MCVWPLLFNSFLTFLFSLFLRKIYHLDGCKGEIYKLAR